MLNSATKNQKFGASATKCGSHLAQSQIYSGQNKTNKLIKAKYSGEGKLDPSLYIIETSQ